MRAESIPSARQPRRGNSARLERAVLALAGDHGRIVEHRERNWASITFAGTRHTLRIVFDTPEAIDGGETLIAALPDHEFALPARLVADATVSAVDHVMGPAPQLTVTCELLLLEDG
ncbi:hypothetical protein [Citromicrobium bathyomarinum]|uniref:hypothetical protein n=1 Tax=Citromicrobium bathyomarinum TaxID=72174 RepID=UPI00315A62DF